MGEIFPRIRPSSALAFTGERLTSEATGQIEIEHFHRYFAARELARGRRVLDIACGEGYGSAYLAQSAAHVIGVDIDAPAVAHAQREYCAPNLEFRVGSALEIPLETSSVDLVVSFETLEHFFDHSRFLDEVKRVLRPEGILFLSTPDRDTYSPVGSGANPFHVNEVSRPEFMALLQRCFARQTLVFQRAFAGSIMLADPASAEPTDARTIDRRGDDHFEISRGLSRPRYLLALASDAELPPLGPNLYVDRNEVEAHAETAQGQELAREKQGEEIARRQDQIEALRQENESLRRELDALGGLRELPEKIAAQGTRIRTLESELAAQVDSGRALRAEVVREGRRSARAERDAAKLQIALAEARSAAVGAGEPGETEKHLAETLLAFRNAEAVALRASHEADWLRDRMVSLAANQAGTLGPGSLRFQRERDTVLRLQAPMHPRAQDILRLAKWAATFRLGQTLGMHRRIERDRVRLLASTLFDADWYRRRYPDIGPSGVDPALHYLMRAAAEQRDPGPDFSSSAYLRLHPDVRAAGVNPLLHYLTYGQAEGRAVAPAAKAPSGKVSTTEVVLGNGPPQRRPARQVVYVSGEPDTPGHYYRVERMAEAARRSGANAWWMRLDDAEQKLKHLAGADVIILWRAAWDKSVEAVVATARRAAATLVFDVDDLMIVPELATREVIDGIRSQGLSEGSVRQHYSLVQQTMHVCDACTTTTQPLALHMHWAQKTVHVIPNGFDEEAWRVSRLAARNRSLAQSDGLLRIGYAGGSRTHQRDFALASGAVACLLRDRPDCRLVLFRARETGEALLDIREYPELAEVAHRIEWRDMVALPDLPQELARFDINLAPLEVGNPFCEAKSELKFFEAALVDVVTVASPTEPFRAAIRHRETGLLAGDSASWHIALQELARDAGLRRRLAQAARNEALRRFGPRRRASQVAGMLAQLKGGAEAAAAFALDASRRLRGEADLPHLPESDAIFCSDRGGSARVTVVIPVHNYAHLVVEALDSVHAQTLAALDLVVVDDASTDQSAAAAGDWLKVNASRFNRAVLLRNRANAGLGFTRNAGFDAAETLFVLPLDADNRLLPDCCEMLLAALGDSDAAFAYPTIRLFGEGDGLISAAAYHPSRLVRGNFIDAMALVAKEAWSTVGGYDHVRFGWEDYDFWCRCAELGLYGIHVPEILAQYRVHAASMLRTVTEQPDNKAHLVRDIQRRHPWLALPDNFPELTRSDAGLDPGTRVQQ